MGVLGLVGGVGKALLGGGKKKQTGPRMASRMFRREGGKDIGEQEAPPQQAQPTTPLVPQTFSSSPEKIQKATPSIRGTETLEGTAFRIKTSVVEIDTLLKGSLMLDKVREKRRIKNQQDRRKKEEQELEKKDAKESPGLKRFLPKAATSIWSRITKYFVTLFWGFIIMRLMNNIGLFTRLAQFAVQAANFIIDWGGKFLNFIVSFIDGAYWIVDRVKGVVGGLFGQTGLDAFEKLSKTFVMLLNAALIAAMVGARVNMGLNRAAGARVRNPGFWGPQGGTRGKVPITQGRGGTRGGVNPFRRRAPVTGGGRAPLIGGGARPRVTTGGKVGLQALRGPWKTSAAPIIKRIPLVGALMDFAINVFLFGESPGRAAFKAIGAGLGAALLGGLASIIPGIGTLIGAIAGGVAGDLLGGWIYDRIFGGGRGAGTGKVSEKTAGDAIQEFGTAIAAGGAAFWAADRALRSAGRTGRGIKGAFRRLKSGPLGKGKGRGTGGMRKPGLTSRFVRMKGGGLRPRMAMAGSSLKGFLRANALTTAIFTGMDYTDRLAQGQNQTQALAGSTATTAGGLGAVFLGMVMFPEASTSILGGIGLLALSMVGGSVAGATADAITGANKSAGVDSTSGEKSKYPDMPGLKGIFHKGGLVPMDMAALLQGGEIVIDADSSAPAHEMLLAINEAKGYKGVMDVISQYAPYEEMGEKVLIYQTPSSSSPNPPANDSIRTIGASLQWSAGGKFLGGGGDYDPFEILHKGV